ncbi:hypothetical protein L1887_27085 [Cichorium endivia]|nr:hypothetical protein L1887_27085 [Cichorium endivia]
METHINDVAQNLQTANFTSKLSKSTNPSSKSLSFLSFGSKYKTPIQISVSSNKNRGRNSFTVSASVAWRSRRRYRRLCCNPSKRYRALLICPAPSLYPIGFFSSLHFLR